MLPEFNFWGINFLHNLLIVVKNKSYIAQPNKWRFHLKNGSLLIVHQVRRQNVAIIRSKTSKSPN